MVVRRITALPDGLDDLVAESRTEGFGHLVRLRDDWVDGSNRFDGPGEALFAAFLGDELVGVGGLNRDPFADPAERAGRVRRLYVVPSARRSGYGRALLLSVERHAVGWFDLLTVFAPDAGASAFYERLGFLRVSRKRPRSHEKATKTIRASGALP